ncbi:MAG: M2 family metallopeptidase, partial [Ignavibacteria bacterium]|nr:M2 family metallopeptidase [Ignavibacteria bacterium]
MKSKFIYQLILVCTIVLVGLISCKSEKGLMTEKLKTFISNFEQKAIPAFKDYTSTYFNATISGKKEDYDKAAELQIKFNKIFTNKDDFKLLKEIKESNAISDELLNRQLDVLYRAYLKNQIDEKKLEEIIKLQMEIENKFSTFRAKVRGKSITDNEIEETLKNSTDSKLLKETWEASKEIGALVASDVLKLVRMRNETARE